MPIPHWMRRWRLPGSGRGRRRADTLRRRLAVEDLEHRVLLSVITWASTTTGDWSVAGNWDLRRLPNATDDVVINNTGNFSVTHQSGSDTVHSLTANRPFILSGGTLTVTGTVQAGSDFSLAGGTLSRATVAAGTTLSATSLGGTLDQVTLTGTLNLTAAPDAKGPPTTLVTGGLVLNGGTIAVGDATAPNPGVLHFDGTQTLGGTGTVQFGRDPMNTLWTTGGTLTVGPAVTIQGQHGYVGRNPSQNSTPDATFVNQGTIRADGPGGSLALLGSGWSNTGTLRAQNGATLELAASNGKTFSSSGRLEAAGGTILLGSTQGGYGQGSSFSLDPGSSFDTRNGTVAIGATLTNTNRTLALNGGTTGSWQLRAGGVIRGGTVATANGARLIGTTSGGSLNAVTLNGDLDLSANGAGITVSGGLTLNGTVTLGSGPNAAGLTFLGTQTLAGSGTVVFAGTSRANQLTTTNQATLTIGPGIRVRGMSGTLGYVAGANDLQNPSFDIQGTVAADTAGGSITVNAADWTAEGNFQATGGGTLNLQGTFANTGGSFTVAANSTLNLGDPGRAFSLAAATVFTTFAGTVNVKGILNNTGKTLTLNPGTTGSWRLVASDPLNSGQILGGTVASVGGATLVGTPSGGSLAGVVLGSDLDLASFDGAQVMVLGGLTTGGTISLGNGTGTTHGVLTFAGGPQTLAGTGTIVFGPNPLNDLDTHGSLLTIGPGLTLRGYSGAIDGAFDNQGVLAADRAGSTITLRGTGWSNHGTILAQNGGTVAALNLPTNYANGTLTGGTWQVFANSAVRLFGAQITTAAANILLSGVNANVYRDAGTAGALDTLTAIAPGVTFAVQNGMSLTVTGPFSNAGTLTVGTGSTFQALLSNLSGGVLTGGTYLVQGTLRLNNTDGVRTNNAALTLQGPGALLADAAGRDALAGLQTNTASGQLAFLDGRNFTAAGAFSNAGTLTVGAGSSFVTSNLTNYDPLLHTLAGGTFVVGGTLRFSGADVWVNTANLTLDGPNAQLVDQSSQDGLARLTTNLGVGTFTVQNGRNFMTAGAFLNNGTLAVGAGSTFFARSLSNFIASVGELLGGTFLITGTLKFTGADIRSNDANTALIGPAAAVVNENGVNALSNFNLNDVVGTFAANRGSTFTFRPDFRNLGAVTIGPGSTVTLHAGDQVGGGGALLVSPGATLLMAGTSGTGTIVNTLVNLGQIIVQAGTTLNLGGGFANYVGGVLLGGTYDLAGRLQFQGADVRTNRATLILNGPGSGIVDQTGRDGLAGFTANDAGGSLTLANGRTLTTAADFSNDGTLTIATGSSMTVSGTYSHTGTLVVQEQAAFNLSGTGTFSAGTLSGTGAANINGRLTWTGGVMAGPGSTTIAAGARLDIGGAGVKALSGRTLVNAGAVTWGGSGSLTAGNGAGIQNQAGALFDAQGDAGLAFSGGTPATFTNAGTFRKSAGAGTTSVSAGWTFQNSGSVEALAGTLDLGNALQNFDNVTHTLTGGTYRLQSRLQLTGANILTNAAAIVLDGAGAAIVNNGGGDALSGLQLNAPGASLTVSNGRTLTLGAPGNLPGNAGTLVLAAGGVLSLGADLTSTGSVSWTGGRLGGTGTLDVAGGTLAVSGPDDKYLDAGAGIRVEAAATWMGPGVLWLAQGSTLSVMAGGTLDSRDNGSIRAGGASGGLLRNAGTFVKSAGTGTTLVGPGVQFTNTGVVQVLAGTLDLEATVSNLDTTNQALTGGTFDVRGTLKLAGANLRTNAANIILDGVGAAFVNATGADALAGLSLNAQAGRLALRNGAGLVLGGLLTDAGTLTFTSGRISGAGRLDVAVGGLLSLGGSGDNYLAVGGGVTVAGTVAWAGTGTLWLAPGGGVTIQTGGTLDAQANGTLGVSGAGTAAVTNRGTFRRSAGSGATVVGAAVGFDNPGAIEVLTGTLDLEGPFSNFVAATHTLAGGRYTLAGLLKFPGAAVQTNAAAVVLDGLASGVVDQAGRDALAGLTLNDQGGSLTLRNQRVFRTAGALTNVGTMVVELNAGLVLGGTLTDMGAFSWSSGRVSGPGSLDVLGGTPSAAGTLSLTGADDKTLDAGATLRIAGNATWTGTGALVLGDGSGVIVAASGLFDAQNDATIRAGGSTATVLNQGTFRKSAGSGRTTVNTGVQFRNTGTVEVLTGTLDLVGPFTNFDPAQRQLTGGTFALAATLRFPNARINTNDATVVLNGPGAAIVDQSGNDALVYLALNAAAGDIRIGGRRLGLLSPRVVDAGAMTLAAGGSLDVDDEFHVTGQFTWTGGNITGLGTFFVDRGGNLDISGPDDKGVHNSGGVAVGDEGHSKWSGTGRLWVPKETDVTIMAGGTFDARGDGDIVTTATGPGGGFIVNHGLFLKSGGGVTRIQDGIGFLNDGTVMVDAGVLDLEGTFSNYDTADQSLQGGTFIVSGTLRFRNAAVRSNQAVIVLDGPDAAVTDGAGNDALVFLTDNQVSLTVQNGAQVAVSGAFTNQGTVVIGPASTFLAAAGYTQADGFTILADGTLTAGSVAVNRGVLSGSGTINADVWNAGTVAVGGSDTTGVLNIVGDYVQTAAGVLDLKLGGSDPGSGYDQLNISGNASLDGTLNLSLLDGFFVQEGDAFQVLTFGAHAGDFARRNFPRLGGHLYFDPVYADGSFTLVATRKGAKGLLRDQVG